MQPHHHGVYLAIITVLVLVLIHVTVWTTNLANRAGAALTKLRKKLTRATPPRPAPLRELTQQALHKPRTLAEYQHEIDGLIARAHDLGEFGAEATLAGACRYALQGGKRLRPAILMEIARAGARSHGGAPIDPADAALGLEYLHAASLVVDDLPAFDDDADRRGQPSLHAKTTPGTAYMASLLLVTAAFQAMCHQVEWIRANRPDVADVEHLGTRLCGTVTRALGGAARGQYMDTALPGDLLFQAHGPDAIHEITQLKTATFYEIAFEAGWLLSGGGPDAAEELHQAGRSFGTAFQIADDIGDMEQDAARAQAGKPGWNYCSHYGRPAARLAVAQNLAACRATLERWRLFTPVWDDIYGRVWGMASPQPALEPKGRPAEVAAEAAEAEAAEAEAAEPAAAERREVPTIIIPAAGTMRPRT